MNRFRLQGVSLYLTYPQSDPITRAEVLDMLQDFGMETHASKVLTYEYSCIAVEQHQDGHNHIHAFAKYANKFQIRNSNKFDIHGKHGNYQTGKNPEKVLTYITKHGDFTSDGFDVEDWLSRTQSHRSTLWSRDICSKLMTRELALVDVIEENPQLLGKFSAMEKNLKGFHEARVIKRRQDSTDPSDKGCKGIWLWGAAGLGKSRYVSSLYSPKELFIKAASTGLWFDGYEQQSVIHIEDVEPPKTNVSAFVSMIKQAADATDSKQSIKGGTVTLVHDVVWITSNFSPQEVFVNSREAQMQSILRRYDVYHVTDKLWAEGSQPESKLNTIAAAAVSNLRDKLNNRF